MNVFYEEDGDFKAAGILSDQGSSLQIEAASGKRSKIKATQVLIRFKEPSPSELLRNAEILASDIDIDFVWQCAPSEEFIFSALGYDYFGHTPSAVENAALLMRLHGAPMYFYRKARGHYKAAPADALKAALASIERKQQQALLQAQYVADLTAQRLPQGWQQQVRTLLFKPDKNSIEYKALQEACAAIHLDPARLMLTIGGLSSAHALHLERFLCTHFPHGREFPEVSCPPLTHDLPTAAVSAFSIDDHTTTEIDDAFSVQTIPQGFRIGIHIAAPALAIRPGDAIDQIARERYSTVYMPGDKITMLPPSVIAAYTLAQGKTCPALSLYVDVQASDWSVLQTTSVVEQIAISHNLRHHQLEDLVSEQTLAEQSGEYPCKSEISVLWQFAQRLYAQRQEFRQAVGLKPESVNRADYNFYVEQRDGQEIVTIQQRKRDSPIDKLIAELMIFTNSTWGKKLAEHEVAGIYRAQQGRGISGQVRMVTHPAPHHNIGVAQYAWSTSPLRRYVDLVNQWQLLACVQNLAAPFEKNDGDLFAILSGFESAYSAYAEFQTTMERYWCLRWLAQHDWQNTMRVTDALVVREDWVCLANLPLQFRAPGLPLAPKPLARGTRVEIELIRLDEIDLSVECRVLAIIEEVDPTPDQQ